MATRYELRLEGMIAALFKKPLEFDPQQGRILNNEDADRLLNPPRREGWQLDDPANQALQTRSG